MRPARHARVRRPAVAGAFYPAGADDLRRAVQDAFSAAVRPPVGATAPKAIVVPHAGYVYSGVVAASAYARVASAGASVERIVLLGPAHREYVRGMAVPSVGAFSTPLGSMVIDDELRDTVRTHRSVVVDDRVHADEHSLEVQLPFLQTIFGDASILPVAVGDATTAEVADVLESCWGGAETLVVISTDLSHYHRYEDAVELDARTAAAIVARDHEAIGDRDACGARPVRGLLEIARRRGLSVDQIDLCNSGDTAGDRHRVVGYGAFAVG